MFRVILEYKAQLYILKTKVFSEWLKGLSGWSKQLIDLFLDSPFIVSVLSFDFLT